MYCTLLNNNNMKSDTDQLSAELIHELTSSFKWLKELNRLGSASILKHVCDADTK